MMLAAANGDLSMVKLLIVNKAKIEKPDKYKRTALTHAVINGATNVASYLLSLGADPNKKDTSDNSNLHYACAYGWWFCMKVLLESGAHPDAQNSWRLTPLGVAVMKGNKGIVNYMVQLEGIDINMRDEDGKTILMNMICGQENFSKLLREEFQTLIEKYGADPLLKDNSNKNMLHYLAEAIPKDNGTHPAQPILNSEHILMLARYLIAKGCNIFEMDTNGNIPLVYALQNDFEVEDSTRSFALVHCLLDQMLNKVSSLGDLNVNKMLEQLLHMFVVKIQLKNIGEFSVVFERLRQFYREMKRMNIWSGSEIFDKIDEKSDDVTLFGKLCACYTKCNISKKKNNPDQAQKDWLMFCSILDSIIEDFNPNFNSNSSKGNFSALLTLSKFSRDSCQAFKLILSKTDEIDVEDKQGITALHNMIRSRNLEQVKNLVVKGADVNKIRRFDNLNHLPIDVALQVGDKDILKFLIENGAKTNTFCLTGSSLIHKAAIKCAMNKTRQNLNLVRVILESDNRLVNFKAEYGLTPIHVAINSGRDDADLSLDLESLLIRFGADVNALDDYQRTPLHYAFTSLEHRNSFLKGTRNRNESSPTDPIQIVSILVEAMDDNSVHQRDIYGCSSLHFAAQRGATVCALLLLQKGTIMIFTFS